MELQMVDIPVLAAAAAIALVLMKLFEALLSPLWEKLKLDPFYKLYVTILLGGALGWFTGLNGFPGFAPVEIGRVLTALAIGVGPSFLYDLMDKEDGDIYIE
jgi:hypothetical protein